MARRHLASIALILIVMVAGLSAQDWPQWRGPGRDGAVPAASVPSQWPASFASAWRVEVGEGYSSPVVAAGRVFVHSRRDPNEIVTAIDLASGKVAWQQEYSAAQQKNQYAVKMGKGPNATPLVAGGRVFTIGSTGILNAWDASTGKRIWQKDFSKTVDFSKLFCGTSASPLLSAGSVVVQVGSDVGGGSVLALDPATGATRWEWKGEGPGYASPVAITVGKSSQIVTMTNRAILGIDAQKGTALWTVAFPDEWHENIVTPVWTGSLLVVSGIRQGTQAFRLEEKGGAWTAVRAWQNTQASMYMSTPVVADGVIYGLSDKRRGYFVALDLATGAVKWQTEGREGMNASVVLTPTHVVYLTDLADLVVVKRDIDRFTLEKKYALGTGATWTTPVLLGRDVIVKDATSVARLAGK